MEKPYSILLYYCYTPINDPEAFRDAHHLFCVELGLKGRIIVAHEGLNGTVSGTRQACQTYMDTLKAEARFANIDFKVEHHPDHAFDKMHVRVKPEIVHSSLGHIDPNQQTGVHLEPNEFKAMKDQDDVVVLDVRSNYEHRVGHFKNAVTLDIENFRDFPDQLPQLEQYKNKKVITYCTGGIKCEKASAFLLENGFENVYQLHGGIIKYGIEAQGEDFEGTCYVFDNRLTTQVNTVNPKVVSKCYVCGTASDRMVNCANPHCNIHVAICPSCGYKLEGTCSTECFENPDRRPYDGSGYYPRKTNGYNPYLNIKRNKTKEPTEPANT